jgi:hypothetical protein
MLYSAILYGHECFVRSGQIMREHAPNESADGKRASDQIRTSENTWPNELANRLHTISPYDVFNLAKYCLFGSIVIDGSAEYCFLGRENFPSPKAEI